MFQIMYIFLSKKKIASGIWTHAIWHGHAPMNIFFPVVFYLVLWATASVVKDRLYSGHEWSLFDTQGITVK